MTKKAIIIGAGPAGLTAAYELIKRTDIKPIILEKSNKVGGISRTEVYKGNRIDIGGHRFFSKSDIVMEWWKEILPTQGAPARDELGFIDETINKQIQAKLSEKGPDPERTDRVMLVRNRLSRIYFLRRFFNYPIAINWDTLSSLGFGKILKIGWTYLQVKIFRVKRVKTLEEFFISRFGKELYETFFKDYTEKVWGVPCSKIDASWGAQRIKGLSVYQAVKHVLKFVFIKNKTLEQKNIETSLIEQFMYPKLGPGQMWELVAEIIEEKGGELIFNADVNKLYLDSKSVMNISYYNKLDDIINVLKGDYFFSTMPVKHLIRTLGNMVPKKVSEVAEGLKYRDFITVGLLLNKLKIAENSNPVLDNWIYVQEKEVKLGRLQIFNNWSPYLVSDESKIWIGLEYFCNVGDELWGKGDEAFMNFAIQELEFIKFIDSKDVIDKTIIRVPKAYPAYFGTYSRFDIIRRYIDTIDNLFLIGRNGMHKYNNQDHSMLTAITAVDNIISGRSSKENIWNINIEEEYHEKK